MVERAVGTLLAPFAAACLGLVAHEAAHYVACRAFGAPARPSFTAADPIPNPCIVTDEYAHTPTSYRFTSLAPLIVFVPSVGVALLTIDAAAAAYGRTAAIVYVAWLAATFPSWPDLRMAYRAGSLRTLHAVRNGDHATHAAAEGIRT